MASENRVVVYGMWASPFVKMVEVALKIKGIPFEYVEEDEMKNPETILKYNPVYKKLPILVHNEKPICEAHVILEYIDQVWKANGPSLLPLDPYRRALVRFWADFIHKQLFESMVTTITARGEALEKAIKGVREKLKVLEEHGVKKLLEDGSPFVNGNELGFVDIVMWSILGAYNIQEEVLEVKLVDQEDTPCVFSWLNRLIQHPLAKDTLPPKDKVVTLLQYVRNNNAIHSSASTPSA